MERARRTSDSVKLLSDARRTTGVRRHGTVVYVARLGGECILAAPRRTCLGDRHQQGNLATATIYQRGHVSGVHWSTGSGVGGCLVHFQLIELYHLVNFIRGNCSLLFLFSFLCLVLVQLYDASLVSMGGADIVRLVVTPKNMISMSSFYGRRQDHTVSNQAIS